jgi:carbon monoxide dehydrogenase subunit G
VAGLVPATHVSIKKQAEVCQLAGRTNNGVLALEFDNSFEVPLSPPQAWALLMDIRRIAPCLPGAELTEVVDERNYKGKVAVRLGPVALTFAGLVTFEELDNVNRRARVKAQGTDAKGRGGASAVSTFRIEEIAAGGSKVMVHTDLSLSGSVAQYGRGVGIIQATAAQIINQFAANLRARIANEAGSAAPAPAVTAPASADRAPSAAMPISGFALLAKVLWQRIRRLFTGRARSN